MRIMSSRTEAGSAVYLVESGDKEKVVKIMTSEAYEALSSQIENALATTLTSAKKSGVWFDEVGGVDTMDCRFVTFDAYDNGDRLWTSHRFICTPKAPPVGSEEDLLLTDYLLSVLKHVQLSGIELNRFMESLYARFGMQFPGNL